MGPGAGVHGGEVVAHGTLERGPRLREQPHRRLSHRPPRRPDPRQAPQGHGQQAHRPRRHRQQSQERHRRDPARHLHLHHRRLRLGQVQLHRRHALRRRRPPPERRPHPGRPPREAHRPRISRQGDRHRSVADRPHPALQPGHLYRRLHPDPRLVRRPPREPGARLQARPLQLQRQGRPLRGLQGRRPDQDRDALPPRRLRHLRRLPRPALQSRDAGGEVQGPLHRRRPRHDRRGRRTNSSRPSPRSATRCACWRRSASATSRSASRRRP